MAYRVRKTEHSGAKRGAGFWGSKAEAKHQSSRARRMQASKEISAELHECGAAQLVAEVGTRHESPIL
jgi:hypothetical protein